MTDFLIDSNVILDILTADAQWLEWSTSTLIECAEQGDLVINPIIYAEISTDFDDISLLDLALPSEVYRREPLPYEAGFLAGQAFLAYRRRGGERRSPLPDFYIGAHAVVANLSLVTRDTNRYRTYFPQAILVTPD
ncbi:type II toxin-antitoxin system VapC family toxin [Cyanobacteria bacterium FACHB-63]|nr:type II toxin-antitoxin system VapC family toxin [Cyanobacteria bacterium FACHB-63]